jgi:hypothetical protein
MKFRKAKPDTSLRRRLQPDGSDRLGPSLNYHSRRSDESIVTGRKIDREALLKPAKSIGKFWLQRFGLAVLLIVAVICVISSLSVSANPKVVLLGSSDSQLFAHDQADYQQAGAKIIQSSIWNRNKLTVNTAAIEKKLEQQFPEIQSASVTLPLVARRPLVYIQAAQPAVIMSTGSGQYVLDSTGKALATTAQLVQLSSLNLPTVTDQSGLQVQLDHQVLTSDDVSFIQTVVGELKAKNVAFGTLTLPAASRELDVAISGQPYFVKFNLESGDARQQTGTFLAVQARLVSQHITPTKYIDVRLDGRAYYL